MRLFVKKSLGTFRLEVDVEVGGRALVVGPNGSGKSTLLKCLGGVLKCEGETGGGYTFRQSRSCQEGLR